MKGSLYLHISYQQTQSLPVAIFDQVREGHEDGDYDNTEVKYELLIQMSFKIVWEDSFALIKGTKRKERDRNVKIKYGDQDCVQ